MTTTACTDFLQRLIRIRALPGSEGDLAQEVAREMTALGFEQVHRDAVGNVLGLARGRGTAPGLVFNTHLDHVDVGDPSRWPHPPYEGVCDGHRVHGRGAVDIKGPLAAQVHGVARLVEEPGPGDVWVTTVVQEEVGGVGARELAPRLGELCGDSRAVVIVGEPSSNQIRRGHRGRVEVVATFLGRSVHASVPRTGANPIAPHARFIQSLNNLRMDLDDTLGPSSLAPTLLSTDQTSANVVPSEVRQVLDIRTVPDQDLEEVRSRLSALAADAIDRTRAEVDVDDPSCFDARVEIPVIPRVTYTGLVRPIPADNPAYLVDDDEPLLLRAEQLAVAAGAAPGRGVWSFATDGGHFAAGGALPIGIGPGNEKLAHTRDEMIEVEELEAALDINEALARSLRLDD